MFKQLFKSSKPTCYHPEPLTELDMESKVIDAHPVILRCWECGGFYHKMLFTCEKESYTDKVWRMLDKENDPSKIQLLTELVRVKPVHITLRDIEPILEIIPELIQ